MNSYIGEIAALFTALVWSFSAIFFTTAAKQAGSLVVNRTRLLLASIYLSITHVILYGNFLPVPAETYRWYWLGLSGIIGLVLGDGLLFKAFVLIDARLSMLLMALVPIISTLLAWIFLHETLQIAKILAIVLTVGGIVWVVLERSHMNNQTRSSNFGLGVLCGIGGALGQAFALITAKKGLDGDFPALSANLIRVTTATVIFWVLAGIQGEVVSNFQAFKNRTARLGVVGGSFFGPFIGIWLSMVAIKHANIGIAATLMSLPPIFLLPLTHWIYKERHSWRTIVGTILAVAGVAVIFLV